MKINNIHISTLKDCYKIGEHSKGNFLGVGVTAFMRIIPSFFLKNHFGILCYKKSLDIEILRNITNIFCLEENSIINLKKLNTINILNTKESKEYIQKNNIKHIIVYKNNKETEDIIKKMKLEIVSPKAKIRDIFENKKEFRKVLKKTGIEPILGENTPINNFLKKDFSYFTKKYGKKLVIQLPDIKSGGGLGTFFIKNQKDFCDFQNKIKLKSFREITINSINITKFINGISSSIIGCSTKYGTFSSSIQTQLIDIPEVINIDKGSGLFCGHDRSLYHFSKKIQNQSSKMAEEIGNYMYKKGYKGIFGLDLLIDQKKEKVYIVECNSRYTGAFPMISMLDIKQGTPPMDVFHILENTNISYTVDFEKINKQYKRKKEGSHIILANKSNQEIIFKKNLKVGVYCFKKNKLLYKRPGLSYEDIINKNEFIIIDGNPKKGDKIRAFNELSRFCHLLFPGKIALKQNILNKLTKEIIEYIYKYYIK